MSCSSSTTSTSNAMISTVRCLIFRGIFNCFELGERVRVENEANARSALFRVLELHASKMLLDYFLHDRETKSRPFRARRHIGFGQPRPLGWQTNARIGDFDHQRPAIFLDGDGD